MMKKTLYIGLDKKGKVVNTSPARDLLFGDDIVDVVTMSNDKDMFAVMEARFGRPSLEEFKTRLDKL